MTSQINYLAINENFPVAGVDNDTQTFRDNFDTIKTSLRYAQEEISSLQNDAAKLNATNNFDLNIVENVQFRNTRSKAVQLGNVPLPSATSNIIEIDFENGHYHILKASGTNIVLQFTNFPGDASLNEEGILSMGRATLELYGDGSPRIITFAPPGAGTTIKKSSDFPAVLTVTSPTNPIFVEVWRHSLDTIFLRYLGLYS